MILNFIKKGKWNKNVFIKIKTIYNNIAYDDYIKNNQISLKLEKREIDIPQHTSVLGYAVGIPVGLGLAALGEFKIPGMVIGCVIGSTVGSLLSKSNPPSNYSMTPNDAFKELCSMNIDDTNKLINTMSPKDARDVLKYIDELK